MNLENLTPFAATAMPSMLPDGSDVLLVVVQGTFRLPAAGRTQHSPLEIVEEQPPVRLVDEYWGEPDASSLRYEGQSAPLRPGTDVYLNGHAWAPGGKAAKRVDVSLRVGTVIDKTVAVFGERAWAANAGASSPRPFTSMPLVYERAFGGAEPTDDEVRDYEVRNPVGRGFYRSHAQAANQPLPNLEDPRQLISSPLDRPTPACFGPVARSWQPRRGYGGSYDLDWVENIAPMWPADLDLRFFQGAPVGQIATPKLVGGEAVSLAGVAPAGPISLQLPMFRFLLKSYFQRRVTRAVLTLDAVQFGVDDSVVALLWRGLVLLPNGVFEHERSLVRILHQWETPPS